MKERTEKNVAAAFVGEARAFQRLLMYAKRADREGLPQIGRLFRAVAVSEGVHARRHFALLERVADTQTNLERAFESEQQVNGVYYARMLAEAHDDEEKGASIVFTQARDVEDRHAKLYKAALEHLMEDEEQSYTVCTVCGYIVEGEATEPCPVCNAPATRFVPVDKMLGEY